MKKYYLAAIFMTLSAVMHGAAAQAPQPVVTAPQRGPAATAPAPVKVTPKATELQEQLDAQRAETALANEKNDNLQAQMLQQQISAAMGPLQADFNAQEKIVTEWIAAVKKANGWGDNVTYNRDTRKWVLTPAAAAAKTAPQ